MPKYICKTCNRLLREDMFMQLLGGRRCNDCKKQNKPTPEDEVKRVRKWKASHPYHRMYEQLTYYVKKDNLWNNPNNN